MFEVSQDYKDIMNRPVRNRAYINVEIGVINQTAQDNASARAIKASWSKGDIFRSQSNTIDYATLEYNYMKADGSMYFVPENASELKDNGLVTSNSNGAVTIYFPNNESYAVKGLTIDFGNAYPTRFSIITENGTHTYENDKSVFVTEDDFGEISYIDIVPTEMLGGDKRLRIKSILLGIGLRFSNKETKSFLQQNNVSPISEEIPNFQIDYTFFDTENRFDVDDNNSFIDNLETGQKIVFSFGLELDNGDIEWHKVSTGFLSDWKTVNGEVTLTAHGKLFHLDDTYLLGERIYNRTAYDEAVSILQDAGLEADEYYIDDYLKEFPLENPMPEGTHKECLQTVANACRCKITQDVDGRIMVLPNFALLADKDVITVTDNGRTDWSNSSNVLVGASVVYAELTKNFMKANGSMFFMPENANYENTGFVSEEIADSSGNFITTPKLTVTMDYAASYYGIILEFGGNLPQEFILRTYSNDTIVDSVTVTDIRSVTALNRDFGDFDKVVVEFTKAHPNSRIIVNRFSFGGLSDYVLTRNNMRSNPVGYREHKKKNVRVKIWHYVEDENGEAEEVEDNNYHVYPINSVGETIEVLNPLISTERHAAIVAEWIGNHYANNVTYEVDYRGEPRLAPTEIIVMESAKIDNLQVEVTSNVLSFNGAYSGRLGLRRAYNMTKGAI